MTKKIIFVVVLLIMSSNLTFVLATPPASKLETIDSCGTKYYYQYLKEKEGIDIYQLTPENRTAILRNRFDLNLKEGETICDRVLAKYECNTCYDKQNSEEFREKIFGWLGTSIVILILVGFPLVTIYFWYSYFRLDKDKKKEYFWKLMVVTILSAIVWMGVYSFSFNFIY